MKKYMGFKAIQNTVSNWRCQACAYSTLLCSAEALKMHEKMDKKTKVLGIRA